MLFRSRTLAQAIGESGDEILASIKAITKGQLTLRDAAEATNLALSSGFNADQISRFTVLASKASAALGRDLGDSFTRLIRGTAKLEPELLDELGLFTRLEPAVQAYATEIGKSEKFLTNFERRQAFANAALAEGERKFGDISAGADTTIVSLHKLVATFVDLGMGVTNVLATAFKPLADFMSGSLANSLSAVAFIAAVAFKKAFEFLPEVFNKALSSIDAAFNSLQAKLTNINKNLPKDFYSDLKTAAGSLDTNIAGKAGYDQRKNIRESLSKEKASYEDIIRSATELKRIEAERINNIRERLKNAGASGGNLNDVISFIGSDAYQGIKGKNAQERNALKKEALLQALQGVGITGEAPGSRASGTQTLNKGEVEQTKKDLEVIANGRKVLEVTDQFEKAQGRLSKAAQTFSNIVHATVSGISAIIEKTFKWVTIIVMVVSVLELVGTGFLKIFGLEHEFDTLLKGFLDIGAALLGMTKQAEAFKSAISSLTDSSLTKNFKEAGLTATDTPLYSGWFGLESPTSQDEIKKKLDAAVAAAMNAATKPTSMSGTPGFEGGLDLSALDRAKSATEMQEAYTRSLQAEIEKVRELQPLNEAGIRAKEAQIKTLEELIKLGPQAVGAIKAISLATGMNSGDIAKYLPKDKLKLDTTGTRYEDLFLENYDSIRARAEETRGKFKDAAKGQSAYDTIFGVSNLNASVGGLVTKNNKLADYLKTGTVSQEGLSTSEADLTNTLKKLDDELTKINEKKGLLFVLDRLTLSGAEKQLQVEREKTKELINQSQTTSLLLGRQDQLTKTFQNELNKYQEVNGYFNSKGQVATSKEELRRNRLESLTQSAKYFNDPNLTSKSTGADAVKYQLGQTAIKVMAGMLLTNLDEVRQYQDQFTKQIAQIIGEYEILGMTIKKVVSEGLVSMYNWQLKNIEQTKEIESLALDRASRTKTLGLQAGAAALEGENNRLNAVKATLDAMIKLRDAQVAYNQSVREGAAIKRDTPLQFAGELLDQFSGFGTDKQRREIKITLEENKLKDLEASIRDQIEALDKNNADRTKQFEIERTLAENQYKLAQNQAAQEVERINLESSKIDLQIKALAEEKEWKTKIWLEQMKQAEIDRDIAVRRLEMERQVKEAEYSVIDARFAIIREEGKMLDNHVSSLSKLFAQTTAHNVIDTDQDPLKGTGNYDSKSQRDKIEDLKKYFDDPIQQDIKGKLSSQLDSANEKFKTIRTTTTSIFNDSVKLQDELLNKKVADLNAEYNLYSRAAMGKEENLKGVKDNLEIEKKLAGARVEAASKVFQETLKKIALDEQNNKVVSDTDKQKLANQTEALKQQIAIAKKLNDLANSPFMKFLDDFSNVVTKNLADGIFALNDAMVEGTLTLSNFVEGLKDWTRTLLKDIQKSLIQRFVVDPISNWVKEKVGSFASSFMGEKPGDISGALSPDGKSVNVTVTNLPVQDPNAPNSGATGMGPWQDPNGIKDTAKAADNANSSWGEFTKSFGNYGIALTGTFASILASGGDFKTALLGIFASMFAQILKNIATSGSITGVPGGLGSGLFSSIGDWFSGGTSGVSQGALNASESMAISTGATIFSSGGSVRRFAAGGYSGRDTVPSWLEPGEFVMRKSAVDSIGMNNLNRMNNLGANGAQPNVSVNVTNQGTPQDVQGKPSTRFDGQKMIIDVVLKDFANNGPIRQTLRGDKF